METIRLNGLKTKQYFSIIKSRLDVRSAESYAVFKTMNKSEVPQILTGIPPGDAH